MKNNLETNFDRQYVIKQLVNVLNQVLELKEQESTSPRKDGEV